MNFAVASTGGVVVCTNEGNADLGTALPPIHIACMGVEKLVPALAELGGLPAAARPQRHRAADHHVLLALPRPAAPGRRVHIVIVDDGRSILNADAEYRRSLNCIRCGACLNTCPVYRRGSGHSYGLTVPGPIGSVLGAGALGRSGSRELPFASTLCGSCTNVCPVKIDLHDQLLSWRRRLAERKLVSWPKRFSHARRRLGVLAPGPLRGARALGAPAVAGHHAAIPGSPLWPWVKERALPPAPKESFRDKSGGSSPVG